MSRRYSRFPGLPSTGKAKDLIEKARADPKRAEDHAAAEKEHRGWLSLREGDRLARDGKKKEAAESFARTAKDFPGTPAGDEAAARKP